MRRILSLLMALVLAAGVCVFISSCGAEKSLVQSSEIGESWNDFVYGDKTDDIRVFYGSPMLLGVSSIINPYDTYRGDLDEALAYFRELESHITEKLDSSHEYSETREDGRCILALRPKDQKSKLEIIVMNNDIICITFFEAGQATSEFFKLDISSEKIINEIKELFDASDTKFHEADIK